MLGAEPWVPNPRNLDREQIAAALWSGQHTPGGSSGGASASTAAGIAPIAQGSDTLGSIRYPAYCTGLVGLRPSFGRVPVYRSTARTEPPISHQLMTTPGPLTRSVRDARLALEVMARRDLRDPGGSRRRSPARSRPRPSRSRSARTRPESAFTPP
jgi:amidase